MKTTLNGLPLYEDDDLLDARDGFNRAMVLIDKFISRTETELSDIKKEIR